MATFTDMNSKFIINNDFQEQHQLSHNLTANDDNYLIAENLELKEILKLYENLTLSQRKKFISNLVNM